MKPNEAWLRRLGLNVFLMSFFVILFAPVGFSDLYLALGATADQKVVEGRNFLSQNKLPEANTSFGQALLLENTHQLANFFYSVTRLLTLLDDAEVQTFLDRLGISSEGRNLYDWTADFQEDGDGNIILPENSPSSGELIGLLKSKLLSEINAALGNLSYISNTFNFILEAEESPDDQSYEIDYGDVLLYKALLQGLKAVILILDAYNLDVDIDSTLTLINSDSFSINEDLLDNYPNLLKLHPTNQLGVSKTTIADAVDNYAAALDFVENEGDDQTNDLFKIDEDDLVSLIELILIFIKDSLYGPVSLDEEDPESPLKLDLSVFFDHPFDLRDLLPRFSADNKIFICGFPDPTFNGVLPNFDIAILTELIPAEYLKACSMPWLYYLLLTSK
jgi:hypothetical protein